VRETAFLKEEKRSSLYQNPGRIVLGLVLKKEILPEEGRGISLLLLGSNSKKRISFIY